MRKQALSMTDMFMEDMIKTAAAQPSQAQAQQQEPQQDLNTQPQQDPNAQVPQEQLQAPLPNQDMRQSGIPTTAIFCNSDCEFSQNGKGVCSLNKIQLEQVRGGIFSCANYKPTMTQMNQVG